MSLMGKTYQVELVASREDGRLTNMGLIILRQTDDGKQLGETLLDVYSWDDLLGQKMPRSRLEGALDQRALLDLAKGALIMAGRKDLTKGIYDGEDEEEA